MAAALICTVGHIVTSGLYLLNAYRWPALSMSTTLRRNGASVAAASVEKVWIDGGHKGWRRS